MEYHHIVRGKEGWPPGSNIQGKNVNMTKPCFWQHRSCELSPKHLAICKLQVSPHPTAFSGFSFLTQLPKETDLIVKGDLGA